MKIAIASDVHLEFGQLELANTKNAEVLILSGDICTAVDLRVTDSILSSAKTDRYLEFFTACSRNFPHVVYVMGNHEHYHGDYATSAGYLRDAMKQCGDNIHFLDKEVWEHEDHVFIGGTLWTDMNKEDPLTLHAISRMMNDFRCVENSNRVVNYKSFDDVENPDKPTFRTRAARFCPEDAVEDHKKMLGYIKHIYTDMAPWKQMVVVGHHTPSHSSCHPRYKKDDLMNGGYHSDLSEFILDRPGIKLWTHGHTHELFDYMIGTTRVVCNPRGYIGYEQLADDFKLKVVEL